MKGTRLKHGAQDPGLPPNGAYWRQERRDGDAPAQWAWHVMTPNGLLGCLANHTVTEHEDGTITASPSILVTQGDAARYHGFLERGVWRSC